MRRRHLFEFNESERCPASVRCAITRLLQWGAIELALYVPAVRLIRDALDHDGAKQVVDLGSGSGGPWPGLLRVSELTSVRLVLTDRAVDARALEAFDGEVRSRVELGSPTLGLLPPSDTSGVRTAFACLHHLTPDELEETLAEAAQDGHAFVAIEVTERKWSALLRQLLLVPAALVGVACIRPTAVQLALTYLVPVIPLALLWDGLVSCLRSYHPEELLALARRHAPAGYTWEAGVLREPGRAPQIFLSGRRSSRQPA